MSEILDCNVSVVEDLHKTREPLPLAAVYFVQPTSRNVERILADFPEGERPLYQSVHIFFSSQVIFSNVHNIKILMSQLIYNDQRRCALSWWKRSKAAPH